MLVIVESKDENLVVGLTLAHGGPGASPHVGAFNFSGSPAVSVQVHGRWHQQLLLVMSAVLVGGRALGDTAQLTLFSVAHGVNDTGYA